MNWLESPILVTGATGFIGGRICERLVMAGAKHPRAMVHSPHRAARIARLSIELRPGDLLDRDSLHLAVGDAATVIHCGLGSARGIVRGTRNLLSVCEEARVRRFVHISTAAVHGLRPPAGSETEDYPVRLTGDGYCDNKARAEQAVLQYGRRGLPLVILRPSIVYGPYSSWSTRLIEDLRQKRVALIDGGKGACNTTYVDNLVDAVFASIENDSAIGKTFFITDGEFITWGDFILRHAAMFEREMELPNVEKQRVLEIYKKRPGLFTGSFKALPRILRSRELRQLLLQVPLAERLLTSLWSRMQSLSESQQREIRARVGVQARPSDSSPEGVIPDEVTFSTQTGTVFFSIERARRVLGYSPRISFAQGTDLVEKWLRFANYI